MKGWSFSMNKRRMNRCLILIVTVITVVSIAAPALASYADWEQIKTQNAIIGTRNTNVYDDSREVLIYFGMASERGDFYESITHLDTVFSPNSYDLIVVTIRNCDNNKSNLWVNACVDAIEALSDTFEDKTLNIKCVGASLGGYGAYFFTMHSHIVDELILLDACVPYNVEEEQVKEALNEGIHVTVISTLELERNISNTSYQVVHKFYGKEGFTGASVDYSHGQMLEYAINNDYL